jgi:hypothetical protein
VPRAAGCAACLALALEERFELAPDADDREPDDFARALV